MLFLSQFAVEEWGTIIMMIEMLYLDSPVLNQFFQIFA